MSCAIVAGLGAIVTGLDAIVTGLLQLLQVLSNCYRYWCNCSRSWCNCYRSWAIFTGLGNCYRSWQLLEVLCNCYRSCALLQILCNCYRFWAIVTGLVRYVKNGLCMFLVVHEPNYVLNSYMYLKKLLAVFHWLVTVPREHKCTWKILYKDARMCTLTYISALLKQV